MTDGLLDLDWRTPAGVRAAFTTRLGGVSAAPWDSFNLGTHVGDDLAAVAKNRARLGKMLALPGEPAWLEQVHGTAVRDLDAPSSIRSADAAIARERGRIAVIMVADCLPVLFAARDGAGIGAAHAGWRGLAAGVLEETVRAMGVPAAELTAWLGPAILQPNFEVGDDVRAAFVSQDDGTAQYFAPNAGGRWQADLVGIARRRLGALGIGDVSGGGWCTYADPHRFFSHRRDGHRGDGRTGRMAALIWRA